MTAWVKEELTTGEMTITAKEAKKAMMAFAKKHGIKVDKKMKKEAAQFFDYVDADDNDAIDLEEMSAAWEAHGADVEAHCGIKLNW